MVDILKKFLWRGAQEAKRWALVAWTNNIKPKIARGLGLRCSYIITHVTGGEI